MQNINYFVFHRKKDFETGTEHFQLYVEFDIGKKFEVMKQNFPTAHIESRKVSKTQARDYCRKNDTRMDGHQVYEYGEFTENGERSDLSDITQMIESGATDRDIQLAYPSQFFRYYKNIAQLRQVYLETKFNNVFWELEITYVYGLTEKGKTRYVMDKYGYTNVYRVTTYDHTAFDSYNGQDIIAFEEFRSSFKIEDMLKYLEGYPLMLPSRYNNKVACYTKVYIITNWSLQEQYKNVQREYPSTWQAFLRRIKTVFNFDKSKEIPVNKLTGELAMKQMKLADLIPIEDNGALPF